MHQRDGDNKAGRVQQEVSSRGQPTPGRSPHHDRLREFESFDEIRLYVVPRFKTSGLSGDEWRQHVQSDFFFKGEKVAETGYNRMRDAIGFLYTEWVKNQEPIPERIIEIEKTGKCDQPSCREDAVARFWIGRKFGERGERLADEEAVPSWSKYYRQFCEKHSHRGDSDREDNDQNYTREDLAPSEAKPLPTKERLARTLDEAGLTGLAVKARGGVYDDYESEHASPIHLLVDDLRAAGRNDLAAKAIDGEWDGTKEEFEAWMRREGAAVLMEGLRRGK